MKKIFSVFAIAMICNSFCVEKNIEENATKANVMPIPVSSSEKGIMIIQPADRANDLKEAISQLQKEQSNPKFYIKTIKGKTFSNITSITPLNKGTIVIIQASTIQGQTTSCVFIEDVIEFGMQ